MENLTANSSNHTRDMHHKNWYALDVLWEGDEKVVEQGLPHEELSPAWQILLLGDFSPTRHFKLLTGEPIEVDVIDMSLVGTDNDGAPGIIYDVPAPRLRRQVWLRTVSGQRLGYAVSWWHINQVGRYLQKKSMPIWNNLSRLRTEIYREIRIIQYGNDSDLEGAFQQKGPFWGRYYFFYHQKKPLTLIYEVFSPHLTEYLGKCRTFSLHT
jgi:chorismate lyase